MITEIPIYGGTIEFHTNYDTYKSIYESKFGHDPGELMGIAYSDDGVNFLIGVFDGSPQTLVHEMVHTAVKILDRCEIELADSNSEPLAYLVDWLFNKFFYIVCGGSTTL